MEASEEAASTVIIVGRNRGIGRQKQKRDARRNLGLWGEGTIRCNVQQRSRQSY